MLSLTAVVRDEDSGAYTLRTYDRDEADCAALLTHLGRSLVTEVVLRVSANTNLRCVSRTDIPAGELFGAPGAGGRTFESFLDRAGRVETIWERLPGPVVRVARATCGPPCSARCVRPSGRASA